MREIKFEFIFQHSKSKEIKIQRFTLQDIIEQAEEDLLMLECDCEPIGETNVVEYNCEDYLDDFKLIDKRQYTGIKDKNGKEIYESDLILWRDKLWIVAWRERSAGFAFFVPSTYEYERGKRLLEKHFCGRGKDYEIIGNIYENPELLK